MLKPRYILSLLLGSSLAGGGLMVGALSAQELSTAQAQITFLAPNAAQRQKDRRRWGRPTTRTPGGTRDRCAQRLIALVPSPDAIALSSGQCLEESVSDRALTLTEMPTLWFYVPPLAGPERQAELVLLQKHREVSKQRVALPAKPGIVGVQLKGPLTADQLYGWSFTVLKQPRSPSQNPTVEGLIRYTVSRPNGLGTPKTRGQLQRYAQAGIWHDALTTLARRRCQKQGSQDWKSFLASAGLDAIATQPILNCEVLSPSAQSTPVPH
ncbi:MAG: DUF928 domain-containing protein [Cyanobacteria bacterium P01_A01_bin.17]